MGSRRAAAARRDRDVGSFDRRDRMRAAAGLDAMLAAARLHPVARRRVYDLGPLPLVQAVIAEPARLAAGA